MQTSHSSLTLLSEEQTQDLCEVEQETTRAWPFSNMCMFLSFEGVTEGSEARKVLRLRRTRNKRETEEAQRRVEKNKVSPRGLRCIQSNHSLTIPQRGIYREFPDTLMLNTNQ